MGYCERFGQMIESDSLQSALCGLLRVLVGGMVSRSSKLLDLDQDFPFLTAAQGSESRDGFHGNGRSGFSLPVFCTLTCMLMLLSAAVAHAPTQYYSIAGRLVSDQNVTPSQPARLSQDDRREVMASVCLSGDAAPRSQVDDSQV